MSKIVFEEKRSKFILILMWVLILIGEAVFGGCSVYSIILIVTKDFENFDNPTSQLIGDIYLLTFCLIIFCFVLAIGIYLTINSIKQVDIFMSDKMYRKVGDKVKFEIKYSNILSIKKGYFNLLFFCCKDPFINEGTRKNLKTFMEYYSRKDINKIIQLILDYQNNTG